jgi:putative PIN family toxin of toxin-antitoxin system
MKIVIDTNVLISGIFFSGPPYQILEAWRDDKVQVVVSPQIMDEYRRVAEIISHERPVIELTKIMDFLIHKAELIDAPSLPEAVCEDPDDDKFLACALASGCKLIVS